MKHTAYSREDFPFLLRQIDSSPIIYLDSASTSLKPVSVLQAEKEYASIYNSNVHRGSNFLAEEVTFLYESARRNIAQFISADPELTVLTPNASYAIEAVAHGLGLKEHDVVLCGESNHHSHILPWARRCRIEYIPCDPQGLVDINVVEHLIALHAPKVLAMGWVSNVTGAANPVKELCKASRAKKVLTVIDASQAAPHLPIDVRQLECDFLAFSGHKMLAPTGTGVLWGRREHLERLDPLVIGGGTIESVSKHGYRLKKLPHRLEAGTPNIGGALGFCKAVDYLDSIGATCLESQNARLCMAIDEAVLALPPSVRVLKGIAGTSRIPIASFVLDDLYIKPEVVSRILSDRHKIITRSGHHCAQPFFEAMNITGGSIRFSAYFYNSADDIYAAASALADAVRVIC